MSLDIKTKATIGVNTITTPPALFNAGHANMHFGNGNEVAGWINVGTGALCLTVSLASELTKYDVGLPLPKTLVEMSENPGAALATNGVLLFIASLSALPNIDPARPETALPILISAGFSTGNMAQGLGMGLEDNSTVQRLSNAYAQAAYAISLAFAATDAPLAIKLIFVGSGIAGLTAAALNKKSLGLLSPNLLNAGGAFASAATNSPIMMITNGLWSAGNASLHTLLNHGGLVEALQAISESEPTDIEIGIPYSGDTPTYEDGVLYVPRDSYDRLHPSIDEGSFEIPSDDEIEGMQPLELLVA